jgi:bleomycin hydrolase
MRKTALFLIAMTACSSLMAQQLGQAELSELKASFNNDGYAKSIHNIISTTKGIKALAYNPSAVQGTDDFFKYSVNVSGITDQKSSGRCWMFTSMNHLRPVVMKKYNVKNFDFSHNYSYFWDILEKANLFLENVIATSDKPFGDRAVDNLFQSPVGDGGVWNLFYNIGEKYGVVPADVMPETEQSNSTGQFLGIVNERLRKGGYEIRQVYEKALKVMSSGVSGDPHRNAEKVKMETLKDVYRVLAICLGEPPAEFTWKYRDNDGNIKTVKTTPQEFYKSIVPAD